MICYYRTEDISEIIDALGCLSDPSIRELYNLCDEVDRTYKSLFEDFDRLNEMLFDICKAKLKERQEHFFLLYLDKDITCHEYQDYTLHDEVLFRWFELHDVMMEKGTLYINFLRNFCLELYNIMRRKIHYYGKWYPDSDNDEYHRYY